MTPQEKAVETRRRHKAAWDRKVRDYRERQGKVRDALMGVISNPDATPTEIIQAVTMLEKLGKY